MLFHSQTVIVNSIWLNFFSLFDNNDISICWYQKFGFGLKGLGITKFMLVALRL